VPHSLTAHFGRVSALSALGGLILVMVLAVQLDPLWGLVLGAITLAPLAVAVARRFPLEAVGTWIVLAPWLFRSTEIELGAGIPNLNFERFGIYTIVLVLLVLLLTRRKQWLPLTSFDKAFLLFIGAMLISGLVMGSTPPQTFRQVVSENVFPFVLYFSMKHLITKPQQVRTLALFLLLAATLLACHAFADQVLGMKLGKVDRRTITTHAQLQALGGYHNLQWNRAGGPLGNSILLGVSLVQGVVLAVMLFVSERRRLVRLFALCALVLCGIGIIVTYTRSVYISTLLCGPVVWFWYPRFRRQFLLFGLVSGIVAGGYLIYAIGQPENRLNNRGSINERMGCYTLSYHFIKDAPLLGHGYSYATYPELRARNIAPRSELVSRRDQRVNNTPHSEILRIWITMGLVGLAIFARYLWTLFGELRRFRRDLPRLGLESMRPYVIMATCSSIAFYGQCPFTDMTAMNYADTVLFLTLGAILGVYENALREARAAGRTGLAPATTVN
jgi:hypothetical protein